MRAASTDAKLQEQVARCRALFVQVAAMINDLSLFSSNETKEDLQTPFFKYLPMHRPSSVCERAYSRCGLVIVAGICLCHTISATLSKSSSTNNAVCIFARHRYVSPVRFCFDTSCA